MDENLVFCYGSLMEGFGNHNCLRHAWFVGEGVTYPTFELLDLGAYPAMVLYGRTAVHGEIYAVDDGTLERIDRLEGHPNYFVRSRISLQGDLEVWVYLMREEFGAAKPRIASGDWRRWKQNRSEPAMMHILADFGDSP